MLRIAVIFESSPFDRKGLFNAVHDRIKHLKATGECQVDVFCIHAWDTAFTRRVRKTKRIDERRDIVNINGISYRMLWYGFSITDHILVEKFHVKPFFFVREIRKWIPLLKEYDCIAAHSFAGGLVARAASVEYGIPYYVTWHGSDIHTHPLRNPLIFKETALVMSGAACNFFVSGALMKASERINASARKDILYNGVSERFVRLTDSEISHEKDEMPLEAGTRVVAFVGSLAKVKNVSVLQPLFHEIRARYDGRLAFWIVGDGKLRGSVEHALLGDRSLDVKFFGDVSACMMPVLMNCIDVLVLPSLNEGLPLVCAEAIRCGAAVVGSDVGGIPEVIGRDHVVPHGPDFVPSFAARVVECLLSPHVQTVPAALDWAATARKELSFLKSL